MHVPVFIRILKTPIMKYLIPLAALVLSFSCLSAQAAEKEKPLMRDFMGINSHLSFKPEVYIQVCQLVRNYHNISWDVKKPGDPIRYPKNIEGFDWENRIYGPWKQVGFEINLCAQFNRFGAKKNDNYKELWAGQGDWIEEYGYQLASHKGADGKSPLASIEIGNEPGDVFDSEVFMPLFKRMAEGIRRADPDMKILTCTAKAGEADRWSKSLNEDFSSPEIKALYDVISVHTYAELPKTEGRHPWERVHPESDRTKYLKVMHETIDWRNKNAPDKEVWITEFGWDAPSAEAMKKRVKGFKEYGWEGETELNQAQWIVRSFVLFSELDIDRAYLYWYDDKDQARTHGSSGLTRNSKPKKSFWAVKHFYDTLGGYRFSRVIEKKDDLYVFEFKADNPRDGTIWIAWSPTDSEQTKEVTLKDLPSLPKSVVRSPMAEGAAPEVSTEKVGANGIRFEVTETPTFIMM